MPRSYRHIQQYEKEMVELKEEGMTVKEIGAKFGLTYEQSTVIPDFDKTISIIRSREISVSIILQRLTQLETLYAPPVATTIINNCNHILYLGCQDIHTASYIGQRLGKLPASVLAMPRNLAVLITGGEMGKVVKKILTYSTVK